LKKKTLLKVQNNDDYMQNPLIISFNRPKLYEFATFDNFIWY